MSPFEISARNRSFSRCCADLPLAFIISIQHDWTNIVDCAALIRETTPVQFSHSKPLTHISSKAEAILTITLKVNPLLDTKDISFSALNIFHDCGSDNLLKHRNLVNNQWVLRCSCSLELILLDNEAQTCIIRTAIDEQDRILNSKSVQSNLPGPVVIASLNEKFN